MKEIDDEKFAFAIKSHLGNINGQEMDKVSIYASDEEIGRPNGGYVSKDNADLIN